MGLLSAADAQDRSSLQRYSVPGHGSLQLEVPRDWRVASQSLKDPASVALHLRPASGDAFDVQVTTLWLDRAKSARKTPEQLKAEVQNGTAKLLKRAVEKEVRIEELRGAEVIGYYYSLTDRVPAPGEYKYMTQGMFVTGELLTIFTILYHGPRVPEREKVLRMFANATHTSVTAAAEPVLSDRFSFDMGEPRLRLVVPDIPQMEMGPHPNAPAQPHALYMGSGRQGFSISILMPTADKGMTPRDCAQSSYRSLVSRYGLDPKSVVTHQTNDSTFVMLFPFRTGQLMQFKAYVLSGHGGSHCLEVHISKTVTASSKEAVADGLTSWYQGFRDARIETY
jgi:hypothetical protein